MKKIIILTLAVLFLIPLTGCSQKAESTDGKVAEAGKIEAEKSDNKEVKQFPIRNEANPLVTIVTDFGNMTIELYRDLAPGHADSFLARTNDGFYDGLIFHRVINNFMIQGGDPSGNGTGNAGYFLNAEFSDVPHQDGTLSMARGQSPNSASCQFFVCLARNRSTEGLDGKYTVFGQLITGYEVLHKIAELEVVKSPSGEISKPAEDVYMRKVFVSDVEGNKL